MTTATTDERYYDAEFDRDHCSPEPLTTQTMHPDFERYSSGTFKDYNCEKCGLRLSTRDTSERVCRLCEQPTTQQPTPRPWRVGDHPRDGSGSRWREILTDTGDYTPAYVSQALEVDAALIVRAVNAHDSLVEALRELLDCETNLAGCSGVKLLDAVDKAREALKLAEAE